jgi:hydrogenase small subunit
VGVNWCVGAKSPCIGCTEPGFPDAMSPFNTLSGPGVDDEEEDDD